MQVLIKGYGHLGLRWSRRDSKKRGTREYDILTSWLILGNKILGYWSTQISSGLERKQFSTIPIKAKKVGQISTNEKIWNHLPAVERAITTEKQLKRYWTGVKISKESTENLSSLRLKTNAFLYETISFLGIQKSWNTYQTYGSSALLGLLLMVNTIEKTEDKQLFTLCQLKLGNIFSDSKYILQTAGLSEGPGQFEKIEWYRVLT